MDMIPRHDGAHQDLLHADGHQDPSHIEGPSWDTIPRCNGATVQLARQVDSTHEVRGQPVKQILQNL